MTTLANGLTRYFSAEQLERLGDTAIGIVGAGGLGSNIAVMLVRSGIKKLTIVDHDVVDASNLNRQAYLPTDVGTPKVSALSRYLRMLEPEVIVTAYQTEVTRDTAAALFGACPVMVEAVDGAATKAMLYEIFAISKEFYVTASGMCGFGETAPMRTMRPRANVVVVGDFTTALDAEHPPLAPRVMQAAAMQADAVLTHILSRNAFS